ncbi:MAG: DUF6279 family lipoprotein [Bdellovibrio bacteriovorus]
MWIRRFNPLALGAILALAALLTLSGCSRIRLAYGSADLLLASYADTYLGLDPGQRERWEPELQRVLNLHRREELPHLAAFFDRALEASRAGFPSADTACLVATFRELYQRHAGLAVELAVPLLSDLGPTQVQALEARFARDLAEDRSPAGANERELRQRARRYQKAIEEWTGPLTAGQAALVADLTARMPDTRDSVIAYRTRKRAELINLLRSGAGATTLQDFLTAWLVDYRDLPPDLRQAGDRLEERLVELVSRLGETLTPEQRAHLEQRLTGLRGDLLKLQPDPRLAPLSC